jgi:hypothetical protein
MALNEPVLAGSVTVTAGVNYVVAGVVTTATVTQTVAEWQAAIGGSPVIQQIDYIGRRSAGPFGPGRDDPFG